MTDTRRVNAALKRIGSPHRIHRNLRGGSYYYFSGPFEVPSIYSYTLRGHTTDEIVRHVRNAELERPTGATGLLLTDPSVRVP